MFRPLFSNRLRLIALTVPALLCAREVPADNLDTWNLTAGSSVMYDDNVFRLPSSANTAALIGRSSGSDTITSTVLGLNVSKPYSLQRFDLDVSVADFRYKNFEHLSYTARSYSAAWRWSVTPGLHGNLSSSRKESINSFSDYLSYGAKNLRTDDDRRFDADLELGAGWHVLGGVFQNRRTNSELFVQEGDTTLTSSEAGVRHAFASGSSLTFLNRTGHGRFDNRSQPNSALLLDNKFDQTENEVRLKWPITSKTTLDARVARLERNHEHFSSRDYSGNVGALNLDWDITAKTHISGGWTRELSSYQSLNSSYSITDRFTLNPVWQTSVKTALRFRYDIARRNYFGAVTATSVGDRSDSQRTTLIAFDWQPTTSVGLSASIANDRRTSNQPGLDYKDTTASITAQMKF